MTIFPFVFSSINQIFLTFEKMSLAELLSLHGDLETQVHFNFMVDLAWFAQQRHQERGVQYTDYIVW